MSSGGFRNKMRVKQDFSRTSTVCSKTGLALTRGGKRQGQQLLHCSQVGCVDSGAVEMWANLPGVC